MRSHASLSFIRARFWACAGTCFLALAVSAAAQNTAADDSANKKDDDKVVTLEKYQVTGGFAGSLAAAAEVKEQMPVIAEVIAAEDIGKLPDISIADSLTRVTGLAAQRTNGRNQQIVIRGLNSDFSTGMLNGREQVSTGENRGVEFDQYPAELLNEVIVYKTASADLTGQGLAGTIDLRTVQPLSKGGRTVVVNAFYNWTEYGQLTPGANKSGERATVSYIDQFDDGKVGIALGFAHTNTPWEGKQFQAWGYPTDADGNFALGGTKSYVRTSNLDRDGFMGILEFKPNENIHSVIDVYYSKFEEKQLLRGMEIPLAFWSSANLQPGYTVSNGLITQATLTNVQPVVRNDIFKRNDTPFAIGWNLELGRKSDWPVTFDAAYSRITRSDENLETYSGIGFRGTPFNTADTMSVNLIPGEIPVIKSTLDYADGSILKLSDPQGWGPTDLPGGGMFGYLKFFKAKDELDQFKLTTTHAMPAPFKDVEIGASYSERFKKDGEDPSGYLNSPTGSNSIAMPATVGTTDMSFLGLGNIYAYDPLAAYGSGVWGFTQNNSTDMAVNTFNVNEKVSQVFVQFDFDGSKWRGVPVTGNLGIRAINVDQSSKGLSANAGQLNPVSGGDRYTDLAPSLNLNLLVAPQTYIRFSAARQLARPRMYDMRASQSWSYDPTKAGSTDLNNSPWSASGGNVRLRPWKADSLDLSIEKYFSDNRGYIAVAAFYKDLVSYIYGQSVLEDFTGYPVKSGGNPALDQGISSEPQNGRGGGIQGLEFTWSLPSELISREIRGFGLVLNGAYTDSSIEPWGPGNGTAPIAGLSRKVANVTFYYEHNGFSARISDHYRSANRQYITTFGPPNRAGDSSSGSGFTLAQPENVIDAQISYSLQSGPAKGLTFYVQGYNLNDEPLITYNNGDPRQVMNYQKYGASYSVGASYKF
ncbi:MAG TPA: TonB-dependent receptor [Opitutus sp.]|nr:TonB-dependent receptor [Opitutus sp.]